MNDEERLRTLVRALLPFALAAEHDNDVSSSKNDTELGVSFGWWDDEYISIHIPWKNGDILTKHGEMRALKVGDLRAAADALRAAGYADALTDDSARAALGGDE